MSLPWTLHGMIPWNVWTVSVLWTVWTSLKICYWCSDYQQPAVVGWAAIKANLTWSKRVFSQGMRHPSGSILTSDIQYHHASGGWIQYLRAHRCFTWNLFFSSSVFILKHDLRNPSLPGQVFISLEFRAHPSLIQVIYNCWAHGAGARHKKPF